MTSFASQLWTLSQAKEITGTTHLVLKALASFSGPRGLFPSHESIAARAGCSTRSVIRALEAAYRLGIVERTRQRVRRGQRLVNGPNCYRLIITTMEQAKAAALHNARRLREALERRKQRLFSNCQNDSGSHSQSSFSFQKSRSPDEWKEILGRIDQGFSPREAGYD